MKPLKALLEGLPCEISGPADMPIQDVTFDSRKVKPGTLFVAMRGAHHDGHEYIPGAIAAGAKAVLCELAVPTPGATRVRVKDAMQALSHVALRFWDYPSQRLLMVGITGTNGKTTISYLVESIFQAAGWPTGVMGTINYRFKDRVQAAPNTTPFSSEVQRFLAEIGRRGGKACAMEVSSHALALGRVEGVAFDAAVFTNLTQDHLDFHKTLEDYGQAKLLLFKKLDPRSSKPYPRAGIINLDDPWAPRFREACRVPVLGYSLHAGADVYASDVVCDASGSRFRLHAGGKSAPVKFPLLGEYNVMNALAAAGVGVSQRMSLETIVQGLETVTGVPGRMERIQAGQAFTVVVDYAHTEDALRNVMGALRRLKPARLITVFGCGGDRDRTKRPLMGEAAAQLGDYVVVTSDNPRSEDPERITLDVEVGVRRVTTDRYRIILDREEAIASALGMAKAGDIVLIAGKGHETYQLVKDKTLPFDDREVARRILTTASTSS